MNDEISDSTRELLKTMTTASDMQDIANGYNVTAPFLRFLNHEITRCILVGARYATITGYFPEGSVVEIIETLNKIGYDVDHETFPDGFGIGKLHQLIIGWDKAFRLMPQKKGTRRYIGHTFPGDNR